MAEWETYNEIAARAAHDDDGERRGRVVHEWYRARLTGNMVCSKCGLLPLDSDDIETECEGGE